MNVPTVVSFLGNDVERLKKYCSVKSFQLGEFLFKQNDQPDGCFYILSGQLVTQYYDADVSTDIALEYYGKGDLVGAMSLIADVPRAMTVRVAEAAEVLFLSTSKLEELQTIDELAYQEFLKLFNTSLIQRVRKSQPLNQQAALKIAKIPSVDKQMSLARLAHEEFLSWPEETVDEIITDIAKSIYAQAKELAELTQQESGMGVVEHKILKIKLGSLDVADSLVNKPGNGAIELEANGIERVSMPIGVVFGMIPITNPVETTVFKTLISLKSRNAIVISSHRKGRLVGEKTVEIIRQVLKRFGAPENLVQTPELAANRKVTNAYMTHDDISMILATGGPSMVKSAYSSGTPAIGVGKGNAPVWICDDCDVVDAAKKVINSKAFDNGVVCGSENNLVVDRLIADEFLVNMESYGAVVLSDAERELLLTNVFAGGRGLQAEFIGQSAADICLAAGIERDYEIKLILAEVQPYDFASILLREKLAPVLSFIRNEDDKMALEHAYEILELEGKGHTAIIHTNDKDRVRAFSAVVQVSRVLVSTAGTQGCIGADNGLNLSWTLGCGTMGGGSVSDNVSYTHLQNNKRIAY
ncbi:MAG: acetaldehyde dehydrogenase/alcohol dehydrogenase [Oleispira sp.]|jgi:acetaldehyde dehydrogenase/alcohol dehydrogenase